MFTVIDFNPIKEVIFSFFNLFILLSKISRKLDHEPKNITRSRTLLWDFLMKKDKAVLNIFVSCELLHSHKLKIATSCIP